MRNSPCKKVCLSLEYHPKFYFMFYFNSKFGFEHFKMQAYLNLGGQWNTIKIRTNFIT